MLKTQSLDLKKKKNMNPSSLSSTTTSHSFSPSEESGSQPELYPSSSSQVLLLSSSPASSSSSSSSNNSSNDNYNKNNNNNIVLSNALGSACAGIISRIVTHPLDTAKARLQAPVSSIGIEKPYTGPFDVIRRTLHKEGIRGLYQGFGTVVIGGTPGTVCYLCTYEYAKEQLSKQQYLSTGTNDNDFIVHFSSGMIAETIACIIYVPVDVIKVRI